jgi:hypothetical protein
VSTSSSSWARAAETRDDTRLEDDGLVGLLAELELEHGRGGRRLV